MQMKFKSALALAAALACGSVLAGPSTTPIEFENPALATSFFGGNSFTESAFKMTAIDPWGSGFVGAGSASPDTCAFSICPSRSSSYYAVLNDGSLKMERSDGSYFALAGFDAGFIAEVLDPSLMGLIGKLVITGTNASGTMTETFDLQGILGDNTTQFGHFDFSAQFAGMGFSSVEFGACLYDGNDCNVGASFNLAKFGLDSIQVIPEPDTYALIGLGLVAAGFATRRRRAR